MIAIEAILHGATLTIAIIEEAREIAKTLLDEISQISPDSNVQLIAMDEINGEFDLLINATPVGMYPRANACPVSEKVISRCKMFLMRYIILLKQNLSPLPKDLVRGQLEVWLCLFYRQLRLTKSGITVLLPLNRLISLLLKVNRKLRLILNDNFSLRIYGLWKINGRTHSS